jgi:hypothetical protein
MRRRVAQFKFSENRCSFFFFAADMSRRAAISINVLWASDRQVPIPRQDRALFRISGNQPYKS